MSKKLKIPEPDNIKFWGFVLLVIIGLQGYMWIAGGVFAPVDIYIERESELCPVDGTHYTTVYWVSDYLTPLYHEGDPFWKNMNQYSGHIVNMKFYFNAISPDMIYLIRIGDRNIPMPNSIAGSEGFGHYLPGGVPKDNFIMLLDYRGMDGMNELIMKNVSIPIDSAGSDWYLVIFVRHMAGYDWRGDWINPAAKITLNITAVS